MPSQNRIDPVTVANKEEDARLASITATASPTGTPMIPPKAVPWLMIVSTVCGLPAALLAAGIPIPAAVVAVGSIMGTIAVILLGGSPGLRKQP